jgi:thiamine monophosphate kinase
MVNAMRQGGAHLIVRTAKLAIGVTLPGMKHVAVVDPVENPRDLAQMVGHAGRSGLGLALTLRMDPPDLQNIHASVERIQPDRITNLCYWSLIKKALVTWADGLRHGGRWELTLDE